MPQILTIIISLNIVDSRLINCLRGRGLEGQSGDKGQCFVDVRGKDAPAIHS